jgi:hypothetical protein
MRVYDGQLSSTNDLLEVIRVVGGREFYDLRLCSLYPTLVTATGALRVLAVIAVAEAESNARRPPGCSGL